MSITFRNDTNIGLKLSTTVLYSDYINVWPGQTRTLSGLNTGPAYNPRTIKVQPMRWYDSTDERKAQWEANARVESIGAAFGAGGYSNLPAAVGEAVSRFVTTLVKGDGDLEQPTWAQILYKGDLSEAPLQLNIKTFEKNSATLYDFDITPNTWSNGSTMTAVVATGGLDIENNDYLSPVRLSVEKATHISLPSQERLGSIGAEERDRAMKGLAFVQ